jgi:hypothetical protein
MANDLSINCSGGGDLSSGHFDADARWDQPGPAGTGNGPINPNYKRLEELARMDPIRYEQIRQLEAGAMGVRVTVLDSQVERRRPQIEHAAPSLVEHIDPWAEAVQGPELLEQLAQVYSQHLVLPEHGATTAALWILHTYAIAAATWTPILCWQSPTPRCGKTIAEAITAALAARAVPASNISAAALFRFIDAYAPTLILDEADTYANYNEELRGVLNSGHTRATAYVIRCDGENNIPRRFSTWGAKSIALIGKLPATLQDRSIVVPMRRKLARERVERLPRDPTEAFKQLRRRCRRWADDHLDALRGADPQAISGLNDRAADNWRSLLAIAEVVGGKWPERAGKAAVAFSGGDRDADDLREQLLVDIRDHFHPVDDNGCPLPVRDRVRSRDLADALAALEGRPWADWRHGKPISPNQVAKLLAPFSIVPKTVRFDAATTAKGYEVRQFQEAFDRYLPAQTDTTSQAYKNSHSDVSQDVTTEIDVTAPETSQRWENQHCDGVTVQSTGDLGEEVF